MEIVEAETTLLLQGDLEDPRRQLRELPEANLATLPLRDVAEARKLEYERFEEAATVVVQPRRRRRDEAAEAAVVPFDERLAHVAQDRGALVEHLQLDRPRAHHLSQLSGIHGSEPAAVENRNTLEERAVEGE